MEQQLEKTLRSRLAPRLSRGRFLAASCALLGAAQLPRAAGAAKALNLKAYLGIFAERQDFFGAVALRRGTSWQQQTVGYADLDSRTGYSSDTAFAIGSISKHFTSVALLLLQRAGKLHTDDPLTKFLPELTYTRGISLAQIMAHRGGLPRDFGGAGLLDTGNIVKLATNMNLAGAPGTYAYSNVGYALLAAVVARTSGRSFNGYVTTQVLEPAGMAHSGLFADEPPAHLATGYLPGLGRALVAVPQAWQDNTVGAGSVYATLADMMRWDRALWDGTILTRTELAELTRDRGDNYGFGLVIGSRGTHRVVGHDGQTTGFIARYDHFPEEDAAIVTLGNVDSGAESVLKGGLTDILFGAVPGAVALPSLIDKPVDAAAADHYVGTYIVSPQFDFRVEYGGGALSIPGNGGRNAAISPTSEGSFFYRELYATLRFSAEQGPAAEIVWTDPGGTYHCKRKVS
jgi:D-alanyl-D-alanine carboxypeptidase